MKIKYYIDPDTNEPHIYKHEVEKAEIMDFFTEIKYFEFIRKDKSFESYGRLKTGRYLQVAYRKERDNTIFVITAYDIEDKEIINALEARK